MYIESWLSPSNAKVDNSMKQYLMFHLQDLTCGYTALHWAAKHGNMDMVKLIAGTYKAHVNARSVVLIL